MTYRFPAITRHFRHGARPLSHRRFTLSNESRFDVLYRLLLLFIVVPLAELALLLMIGEWTHWWVSWLLVIASGVIGTVLVRWQGIQTFRRIRTELTEGRSPADSLWDAAMIFFAGALMLTPGVLTDLFGISLLVPGCRRLYKKWIIEQVKQRFRIQTFNGEAADTKGKSRIIETYVVDAEREGTNSKPDE